MIVKEEKYLKYNIIEFDILDSTMNKIKEYSENTIVVAKEQTAGRGRYGHIWESSNNENLYTTIKIKQNNFPNIDIIMFLTNLSIRETIESISIINSNSISIFSKLHNDILINGKKVSGILIEREDNFFNIGIGININYYPKNEYLEKMSAFKFTSLRENNIIIDKWDFLKKFLVIFEEFINEYNKNGFRIIKEKFLNKCYKLDKEIEVEERKAIFKDIKDDGTLIFTLKNGKEYLVEPEKKVKNKI